MGNAKLEDNDKFIFENLDVYQLSLELSIEICRAVTNFSYKYSRIRDQFIGAIISIPLNIAEGNGRGSSKEKINFFKIARSSSFECIPLLSIIQALELLNNEKVIEYRQKIKRISSMLSGLINYQKSKN